MKRNNESGSPEPLKLCRELRNNFYGGQNKTKIVLLRIVCNGVIGASLTSPLPNFLLSKSVVNVILRKLHIRHSLFPPTRTAKPIEGSRVRTKPAQSLSTCYYVI